MTDFSEPGCTKRRALSRSCTRLVARPEVSSATIGKLLVNGPCSLSHYVIHVPFHCGVHRQRPSANLKLWTRYHRQLVHDPISIDLGLDISDTCLSLPPARVTKRCVAMLFELCVGEFVIAKKPRCRPNRAPLYRSARLLLV